jgi:phospholipase/carboxylesterase
MDERHTRLADLQTCLIEGPGAAEFRIIFLHGYDMRASDLTPFAHSLAIPGVAYAFPQAPAAVSARGYAWWPGVGPRPEGSGSSPRDLWQEYPAGRDIARAMIRDLIDTLRAECAEPLMLAGFSQGGMLACDAVLMESVDVAALALMSASCIASGEWQRHREHLTGMPAFVSHGRSDADLAFGAGQRLASFLTSSGASVTWMPFDGGHEIPFPVWKRFKQFVRSIPRVANEGLPHAHETH